MPVPGCQLTNFIDWQIPDPREMNEDDFRKVRDQIGEKVKGLLKELDHS